MSIDTIINIFEQYGWPGLMTVMYILFIYFLISKKDKKSNDAINAGFNSLANTITKQNEVLIEKMTEANVNTQQQLFNLVDKAIDDKDNNKETGHKKSIEKRIEIGEKVDEMLFDILLWSNAQRAVIIEFHNSKENLDGLSFIWYDIQHEKQQKGIETLSAKARNLQATNIRPIINRVNNSLTHIVHLGPEDIENIYNESTVFYQNMKEIHAAHLIYCGIYNTETNELIGLLGLEFQEGYPFHDDRIDYYILKEKAGVIEYIYNNARKELADEHKK